MNSHSGHHGTLFGTIGGTLLSVFASVQLDDVFKTLVLAVIGAVTSFTVSIVCKIIARKIREIKLF